MFYCPICDNYYRHIDNRHIGSMSHIKNLRHWKQAILDYNKVLKDNPHNIKMNNELVKITQIYNEELDKFINTGIKVKGINY